MCVSEVEDIDVDYLWSQQDGNTCRTANKIIKKTFGERLEPVTWHPRLCDLTPLDHFLWRYVKSNIVPWERIFGA